MSDLKACPFCGGEASIENDGLYRWVECLNSKCEASARVFMFINDVGNADYIVAQNWNTRPLEDAANARAEAAEARQVKLHEAIIEGSAKAAIVIHDSLVRSGAIEQHSGISVELAQIIAKEIIATYALKGGEG